MIRFVLVFCVAIGMSASIAGAAKPKLVKVFILAGQSNMQGHGRISMKKDGDPIPEPRTDSEFLELAG